jgi:pentatricopeptide repeat protein
MIRNVVFAAVAAAFVCGCGKSWQDYDKEADALLSANKAPQAIALLQEGIEKNPSQDQLKTALINAYFKSGQHDEARRYLELTSNSFSPYYVAAAYYDLAVQAREKKDWAALHRDSRRGADFAARAKTPKDACDLPVFLHRQEIYAAMKLGDSEGVRNGIARARRLNSDEVCSGSSENVDLQGDINSLSTY